MCDRVRCSANASCNAVIATRASVSPTAHEMAWSLAPCAMARTSTCARPSVANKRPARPGAPERFAPTAATTATSPSVSIATTSPRSISRSRDPCSTFSARPVSAPRMATHTLPCALACDTRYTGTPASAKGPSTREARSAASRDVPPRTRTNAAPRTVVTASMRPPSVSSGPTTVPGSSGARVFAMRSGMPLAARGLIVRGCSTFAPKCASSAAAP